MPHLQEKLYKPEDDETTYEDSAWGDPWITGVQRMRQEVPNQIGTKGTSKNKLRRGEKLSNEGWEAVFIFQPGG